MAPEHTVAITRVYHFSAAHRLANAALSDEANEALYGACARLHGHNYYLEVTVTGTPDPLTGMAVDLGRLDAAVHRTLLDKVDHARLEDAPALAGVITTGESLARAFTTPTRDNRAWAWWRRPRTGSNTGVTHDRTADRATPR
jgi:6-pyruvoyltetrahydropterin/6-carboxytetrahydropterin synthase